MENNKNIIVTLAPSIVAILALVVTVFTQVMQIRSSEKNKEYEVTFNEKRKVYSEFIASTRDLIVGAKNNKHDFMEVRDRISLSQALMEPFLKAKAERDFLDKSIRELNGYRIEINSLPTQDQKNKRFDDAAHKWEETKQKLLSIYSRQLHDDLRDETT